MSTVLVDARFIPASTIARQERRLGPAYPVKHWSTAEELCLSENVCADILSTGDVNSFIEAVDVYYLGRPSVARIVDMCAIEAPEAVLDVCEHYGL